MTRHMVIRRMVMLYPTRPVVEAGVPRKSADEVGIGPLARKNRVLGRSNRVFAAHLWGRYKI